MQFSLFFVLFSFSDYQWSLFLCQRTTSQIFLSTETMAHKNRRSVFIASQKSISESHNIKFDVNCSLSVFVHTLSIYTFDVKYNKKNCRHTTVLLDAKNNPNIHKFIYLYIYSNIHEPTTNKQTKNWIIQSKRITEMLLTN